MSKVIYEKKALKGLRKMPTGLQRKIRNSLNEIAVDPRRYSGDWKPLKGSPYWRLRVGRYRAICDIRDDQLMLLALKIGPRGDIYK